MRSHGNKIALACTGLTLLIAGCGATPTAAQPSKGSAKTVTLNVLYMNQAGYTAQILQKMGQAFDAKYAADHIHVHFTFLPYAQMHNTIVTAAAAPTAQYDVVLSDLIWTAQFAQKGYTLPLNNDISKYITNAQEIPTAIWNGFKIKGKVMAMPFLANFQNFYYNKKMLKKAGFSGPPTTMTQWVHQMQVLKQKGIVQYPYEQGWRQGEGFTCDYVAMAGEFGANLFNKQGQPTMNQGGALQALRFMRMLYKDGLINPASLAAGSTTAANTFIAGQSAFTTNWTNVTGMMNSPTESKIVGAGAVGTFPIQPGTNATTGTASVSGFQGLAIPANVPPAMRGWAWKWIQFATSPQIQAQHLHSQWPVWTSVANSSQERQLNPAYAVYEKNLAGVYNRPKVANYLQVSAIIQQYAHQAIAGTLPVQTAANDMVKQIKALSQ